MKPLGPNRTDPMGAPKLLLKQKHTVVMSWTIRFAGTLLATAAFMSLAPSMCIGMLCAAAIAASLSIHSNGSTCYEREVYKNFHDVYFL